MSTPAPTSRLAVHACDNTFAVTAHRTDTYRIHLDHGLVTDALSSHLAALAAQLEAPEIIVVIDTGAAEHHVGAITAAVVHAGLPLRIVPVQAGESSKSPEGLATLIGELHQHGSTRRTLLLGVGGGVVCDLVTAAAAIYMRGVPYALVPTTVLAQVDAAIGGKGGIDYRGAKNLIGAFHHPAGVYIDPSLNSTLPARHIRAGLAEVIKVALIADPALLDTLERTASPLPDGQALAEIVRAAIAAKLMLLAPDPFEQKDLRRLLNLGHCIGHPYEAATGYRILHGEAIAAGTAVAAAHAYLIGASELADRDRVLDLLAAYRLPSTIPDGMRDAVWDGMATVRRIRNGPLHIVLPHRPGHCTITDDIDRPAFDKALDDLPARPMTSPPPARAWLLLEGGGSHTWAATATGDTILATAEGPSSNPRSVGEEHAVDTLADLIDRLWDDPATAPLGVVAAHGAASTRAAAGDFAALIRRALALTGPMTAPVLVTNDLTPLLLSAPGPVCVAACGTGTGFAARNGSRWARSSGLEWLLSDEGGGHGLAVAGLRAVIRSLDGRGPATVLADRARQWCAEPDHPGGDLGEDLFFHVYRQEAAKPLVASFARHVSEAAEAGDTVAGRLVEDAAAELTAGAAAVCRATSITAGTGYTLVLTGSLLSEATLLREHVTAWAHEHLTPDAVIQHTPASRPQDLLRLRDLWLAPQGMAPLTAAMPTHADPAPNGGTRS